MLSLPSWITETTVEIRSVLASRPRRRVDAPAGSYLGNIRACLTATRLRHVGPAILGGRGLSLSDKLSILWTGRECRETVNVWKKPGQGARFLSVYRVSVSGVDDCKVVRDSMRRSYSGVPGRILMIGPDVPE